MIKSVMLLMGTLISISCNNSSKTPIVEGEIKEVKSDTCIIFINDFPNTFSKFNALYGYDDVKGKGVLYDKYEENINAFFNCQNISLLVKLNRVIKTCIDGKWDADAVSLFQHNALELIKENPKEAQSILDELSEKEYSSIWYFLFDGPHPNDKEAVKNIAYLSNQMGENSKQIKSLKTQFKKLSTEDNH